MFALDVDDVDEVGVESADEDVDAIELVSKAAGVRRSGSVRGDDEVVDEAGEVSVDESEVDDLDDLDEDSVEAADDDDEEDPEFEENDLIFFFCLSAFLSPFLFKNDS
jgi:hypothetical protein